EEVEHRAVAYDLFTHLDGRYLRRVRGMMVTWPIMLWLWARGVAYLMRTDPELRNQPRRRRKARWRYYFRASRRHLLPPANDLVRGVLRYSRPRYHPSQEFSTSQAVAYLASSPAATEAAV
ncbi:MAG: metal-dependent hydrolase, partial [Pseudonocardiaceae bacterium]